MLDDHADHDSKRDNKGGDTGDEKKLDGGHLSFPPFLRGSRFSFSINSCGQEMFRATDMHLLLHYEGSLPGLGVDCPIARPANRVEGAIGIGAMKKRRRCCAHTKKTQFLGRSPQHTFTALERMSSRQHSKAAGPSPFQVGRRRERRHSCVGQRGAIQRGASQHQRR
jgi:hypothetical protein